MSLRLGIVHETKTPSDSRVPLTPEQCAKMVAKYDIDIAVESSAIRCFRDDEYAELGIPIVRDLQDRDVLLGVKEVNIAALIPNKSYLFFSHTTKQQDYNRDMFQAILAKNITLIDYELLTNPLGNRIIAFGKYAGMVGAHNAIWTYGKRKAQYDLPRLYQLPSYEAAKEAYCKIEIPPLKIVLTGIGRVANGAAMVMEDMRIKKLTPELFLLADFPHPVYTQVSALHYTKRKDEESFTMQDYFDVPHEFVSNFKEYTKVADIMINGIFWHPQAPAFFSLADMKGPEFHLEVIADITCDIAPESSIPSTLRPSTIENPVYGFHPLHEEEISPFQENGVDVMAIDNLPNELPRDASTGFGEQMMNSVIPEFLKKKSITIENATISRNGQLTKAFGYLKEYAGV